MKINQKKQKERFKEQKMTKRKCNPSKIKEVMKKMQLSLHIKMKEIKVRGFWKKKQKKTRSRQPPTKERKWKKQAEINMRKRRMEKRGKPLEMKRGEKEKRTRERKQMKKRFIKT
ncbi:hypothetical protein KP509_14G011400 [Ceratopteris richardii]|uniref:Uncharacterized protein n=1 Tax=Ceratopteris richardii TaxID=49495 RepID=A0A8T2T5N6_CERRI|nr:hypothetical protein KP509_14G011400 [Ceratopteris richardii]